MGVLDLLQDYNLGMGLSSQGSKVFYIFINVLGQVIWDHWAIGMVMWSLYHCRLDSST